MAAPVAARVFTNAAGGRASISEISKVQTTFRDDLYKQLGDKKYDGREGQYLVWNRVATRQLSQFGFDMEELAVAYQDPDMDQFAAADYNQYCHEDDRKILYTLLTSTLTESAQSEFDEYEQNGLIILWVYHKEHKTLTLETTKSRLDDILNLQVGYHEDPSEKIRQMNHIFTNYLQRDNLQQLIDVLKVVLMIRMLPSGKYKSFLDTLYQTAIPEDVGDFELFRKQIIDFWRRKDQEYKKSLDSGAERPPKRLKQTSPNVTALKAELKKTQDSFKALQAQLQDAGDISKKRPQYCKFCKKHVMNHTSSECFKNPAKKNKPNPKIGPCHICKKMGHLRANCPDRQNDSGPSNGGDDAAAQQFGVGG